MTARLFIKRPPAGLGSFVLSVSAFGILTTALNHASLQTCQNASPGDRKYRDGEFNTVPSGPTIHPPRTTSGPGFIIISN